MLVLPSHIKQGTKKFTVSLQRRLGLYVSCAASYYNAMEAEGNKVTVCDRLGDTLTHKGNGQTPHKWVCVAWRQAEASATYSQVLLGDKGNGLKYYQAPRPRTRPKNSPESESDSMMHEAGRMLHVAYSPHGPSGVSAAPCSLIRGVPLAVIVC